MMGFAPGIITACSAGQSHDIDKTDIVLIHCFGQSNHSANPLDDSRPMMGVYYLNYTSAGNLTITPGWYSLVPSIQI